MGEQLHFFPTGLTRLQLETLTRRAERAASLTTAQLRGQVEAHLQKAFASHMTNRMVNIRLAGAMCETIEILTDTWDRIPTEARWWLAGAILYFVERDDQEPDFGSAIGFEDDVEVLNACLHLAHMDDLCLNVEDYDG